MCLIGCVCVCVACVCLFGSVFVLIVWLFGCLVV